MAVVRCEKGHYFDNEKYAECPHCQSDLSEPPRRGISDMQTVLGASFPTVADRAMRQQLHIQLGSSGKSAEDEKTVGIFQMKKGCDPVVGWLVCVAGKERGRDFRLHAGRNFIGRALNNDIALVDDERVTREDHCSLVYEPGRSEFWLARGKGDDVLINGERLDINCQLQAEDKLEIGESRFVFIPFCKVDRLW